MRRRIVAFMLSAAMLLSCAPMQLHAEELNLAETDEVLEETEAVEPVEVLEDAETEEPVEVAEAVATEEVTSEEESLSDASVQYYLQHDGYTYDDGNLYYKGLMLNADGMYETTDSEGNVTLLDPSDPEFDKYVLGDLEEDDALVLRQGAAGTKNTVGLDGVTYTSPNSVDPKAVHKGVDVSRWQGAINWPALKAAGVEFAIIKVCGRDIDDSILYTDERFADNIRGAYNAGIRVGVYVFSQAVGTEEAVQEAQYALERLAPYKKMITMPVFMDYEVGTRGHLLNKWKEEHSVPGFDYKGRHTQVINAFCDTISAAGYTTGVYANMNTLINEMNVSGIGSSYYIWEARYNTTNASYSGRLDCWQYTSKYAGFASYLQGNKSGDKIDCDFWYGDFPNAPTSEASAKTFVTHLYQAVLQRDPDESGLNNWVNSLKSGQSTGASVAHEFYLSKEMLYRNLTNSQYVDCVYQGMLGRPADAAGKASWVAALDAGASYEYVFAGFVGSQEFTKLCEDSGIVRGNFATSQGRDRNINVTAFASRLYSKALGRGFDAEGLNNWCNAINNNPSRENILKVATDGFLNSQEFKNKNLSNTEYVKVLYRVFLDREYDEVGLNSWVDKLEHGATRNEVAAGFAYSKEFGELMTSYGL